MRDALFDNLPWHALTTEHSRLAFSAGDVHRYPSDIAPFAATPDNGADSMRRLARMLTPGETVYVMGNEPAAIPELAPGGIFPCLQMFGPTSGIASRVASDDEPELVPLSCADGPEMLALTDVAFPGFFRIRTCEMGTCFGIRERGQLVAMGGERLAVPGWREISGVCTRPGFTGRGYAERIIRRLLGTHAAQNLHSLLHVSPSNQRAIALYVRLGFTIRGDVPLYPVCLTTKAS